MRKYSPTASVTEWIEGTQHVPARFDKLRAGRFVRPKTGLTAPAIAAAFILGCSGELARAEGIYTCIDAKGRRLTADRPIRECIDREQKELNASGTVKRKIGPSLTAEERAAEEEKARLAAAERSRIEEEKKRDRALLTRYPNRGAHDKERQVALARVDEATAMARKSIDDLVLAHKRLEAEMEFYAKDPSKAPAKLKRQIEENQQHVAAQQRFIANQDGEKRRINVQFDEELARLKQLWAQADPPAAAAVPVKR